MYAFYVILTILIIAVSVFLILSVLIQNPKGGGLNSSFGVSNQVLGARRTTDVLEKSTWTLAIVLLAFSLLSNFFVPRTGPSQVKSELEEMGGTLPGGGLTPPPATAPGTPGSAPANQGQPQQAPATMPAPAE